MEIPLSLITLYPLLLSRSLSLLLLRSSRLPPSPSRSVLNRSSSELARAKLGNVDVSSAFSFLISWM